MKQRLPLVVMLALFQLTASAGLVRTHKEVPLSEKVNRHQDLIAMEPVQRIDYISGKDAELPRDRAQVYVETLGDCYWLTFSLEGTGGARPKPQVASGCIDEQTSAIHRLDEQREFALLAADTLGLDR